MEEDYNEEIKPASSKGKMIAVIALLVIILALCGTYLYLDHQQKEQTARELAAAETAQNQSNELLTSVSSHEFFNLLTIPSNNKAAIEISRGKEELEGKNYIAAEKHFINAHKFTLETQSILKKYSELNTKLEEVRKVLPVITNFESQFPKLSEMYLAEMNEELDKISNMLKELKFTESSYEIDRLQKRFTDIEVALKHNLDEMNSTWQKVLKENTKESYQVFMNDYPHSKFNETAKSNIAELVKAEQEELARKEAERLKKEEELRKENEIIAARKAQQEKELKQKMQMEQVVTLNFDDGSSYTGQLNLEKKPHGDGAYSYTNSNVYRGQFKDGLYHGEGSYEFYTGVSYKGEWQEGLRHGKGLVTWKNGDRFAGTWKEGKIHGKGIFVSEKGIRKEMSFFEGQDMGNYDFESFQKNEALNNERYEKGRLSKNEKRAYEFLKRFEECLQILKDENKGLIFPDMPVYLDKHDSYSVGRMPGPSADKHEAFLKSVYFEQRRYAMVTNKSLNKEDVGETESAEFGGFTIMTANLGVILDNSGSMTQYLDRLRIKINKKFKKSAFIEVLGCSLTPAAGLEVTQQEAMRSTMVAIRYLVDLKGADTIYWFSDLNDMQSPEALKELQDYLYKNMVTFYLSSVGHRPSKELKNIVEESGGKVLRF